MSRYPFSATEAKWQQIWQERRSFEAAIDPARPKYYVLEMFPYPSGRIHMGHVRNYTMGDVAARLKRAQGFNVLHPMGWDAFGLPAENAAIQKGVHPAAWTYANIAEMRAQMKAIGCSLDWSREIATCDPAYYRHEQAMFLDMLERGLVYRKESWVNWDPVDHTVLANEQVIDGRGWRSGAVVERRKLAQWFFRITAYAEYLLGSSGGARALAGEGPAHAAQLDRQVHGRQGTLRARRAATRRSRCSPPGLTPCSARRSSPSHLTTPWRRRWLGKIRRSPLLPPTAFAAAPARPRSRPRKSAASPPACSAGIPFDPDWLLPVYVANFVLMDYGTGAIFGCPAHDQRDLEFARRYDLPVLPVVLPPTRTRSAYPSARRPMSAPAGCSARASSTASRSKPAKQRVIEELERLERGRGETTWRLRDWGVSRQRYWGCPIPVIHCGACGIVPVPREQLPVELPEDVDFSKPGNPLDRHPTWAVVDCPGCGAPARRETDTFDTFIESSWYFARFADAAAADRPFAPRRRRLLAAGRPVYRRRRARRCCTCSIPASTPGPWPSAAISISPSRSPACSPRA